MNRKSLNNNIEGNQLCAEGSDAGHSQLHTEETNANKLRAERSDADHNQAHTEETNLNKLRAEEVIRILGMVPLEGEGGMWSQTYVSDEMVAAGEFEGRSTDRPVCGTIHYMLKPDSFSCMHRLVTDEIWYHHCGPAVKLLLIYPDGRSEVRLLGQDLLKGERPQITVPRGTWQGCCIDGAEMNSTIGNCGDEKDLASNIEKDRCAHSDLRASTQRECCIDVNLQNGTEDAGCNGTEDAGCNGTEDTGCNGSRDSRRSASAADEQEYIYTLMSTSMAPAYQASDFEAGTYEELMQYVHQEHLKLLRHLTSEPVC